MTKAIVREIPALQSAGAIAGTLISGVFLWLIGLINLIIVLHVYGIFKNLQVWKLNNKELEIILTTRGL